MYFWLCPPTRNCTEIVSNLNGTIKAFFTRDLPLVFGFLLLSFIISPSDSMLSLGVHYANSKIYLICGVQK